MAAASAVRSGTTGCDRRNPASRTAIEHAPEFALGAAEGGGKRFLGNAGSVSMRVLGAVVGAGVAIALLAGPAYAQMSTPNVNLIPELASKTPEEKEQDVIKEKAYRESLKKIPDAKASNDPWGNVRSTDAPKTAAPAKSKTKTGSTTN
jgi:hypothetical protein